MLHIQLSCSILQYIIQCTLGHFTSTCSRSFTKLTVIIRNSNILADPPCTCMPKCVYKLHNTTYYRQNVLLHTYSLRNQILLHTYSLCNQILLHTYSLCNYILLHTYSLCNYILFHTNSLCNVILLHTYSLCNQISRYYTTHCRQRTVQRKLATC